jgi:hypothetical protein
MSIEAMKQALDNICNAKLYEINRMNISAERIRRMDKQIHALRQAIEQAEKQEGWVLREVYFSEGEPIGHREPQWVGLKDEDLPEGETYDFDRGVRWAERYLKEKNYEH